MLACLWSGAAASAQAASPADWMYEPTTFTEIKLTLPPASYQKLEEEPEVKYVPGTFELAETDGVPGSAGPFSAPIEVGIRLKGGIGSFLDINHKAAFKVKFNSFVKGQTFDGLEKLTLNNMVQDKSMTHETLAYQAFHALAVPAPHTGFTYLSVNGKSYGLHLNIETQDKDSLEKQFGPFLSPPQHLYEGEYGADVTNEPWHETTEKRWERLEIQEGKGSSKADLEALVARVAESSPSFSQRVANVADLNEMTRMWMVEKYIGHWDGYSGEPPDGNRPNNYYLYRDASGKFLMMPWGTDQTWEEHLDFGGDGGEGGVLFRDCWADASGCRSTYIAAANEALTKLTGPQLATTARCTAQNLRPWQEFEATASEAQKLPPYSLGQMATAVTRTREFIAGRPQGLAAFLSTTAPKPRAEAPCPPLRPRGGFNPPPVSPSPPPTLSPEPPGSLRLGRLNTAGGGLALQVTTPIAGRVALLGTFETADGPAAACRSHEIAAAAGTIVLDCQLTRAFLRRLGRRWMRLRLTAKLTPVAGAEQKAFRPVRLRRR